MRKILFLSGFLLLLFALFPKNAKATTEQCSARGGVCSTLTCASGYRLLSDDNNIPITCGYQQVCCERIPQNSCEEAGNRCSSTSLNPTLFEPVNLACSNSNDQCYREKIVTDCRSPGICTNAPGGRCPSGTTQVSGICGYNQLCCTEPEAPSPYGDDEAISNQKLFCDSSGNPTTDSSSGKLYTAIGCIPVNDTNSFISFILRWAIGIGGGIAFLLILFAGFQIMTSSGNPDRLKAGQELLTSAIAGLIMLIFSVFILSVIGVDILKIPGLTGETIQNVPGPR